MGEADERDHVLEVPRAIVLTHDLRNALTVIVGERRGGSGEEN